MGQAGQSQQEDTLQRLPARGSRRADPLSNRRRDELEPGLKVYTMSQATQDSPRSHCTVSARQPVFVDITCRWHLEHVRTHQKSPSHHKDKLRPW